MFEYLFFNQKPFNAFEIFLEDLNVDYTINKEDENFIVLIADDLGDELDEKIEAFYDDMLDMDREICEATLEPTNNNYQTAGITVDLSDGRVVYAKVDPIVLGKVMQCVTPDELSDIVNAIATAVENPDERSPCQRIREGDID